MEPRTTEDRGRTHCRTKNKNGETKTSPGGEDSVEKKSLIGKKKTKT